MADSGGLSGNSQHFVGHFSTKRSWTLFRCAERAAHPKVLWLYCQCNRKLFLTCVAVWSQIHRESSRPSLCPRWLAPVAPTRSECLYPSSPLPPLASCPVKGLTTSQCESFTGWVYIPTSPTAWWLGTFSELQKTLTSYVQLRFCMGKDHHCQLPDVHQRPGFRSNADTQRAGLQQPLFLNSFLPQFKFTNKTKPYLYI